MLEQPLATPSPDSQRSDSLRIPVGQAFAPKGGAAGRWMNRCVRLLFWTTLALAVVFGAAVAATRFWLVPNADDFRPRVVEELSRLTKQRVVIGGFYAGWNGWSPEIKMTRMQILDPRGRVLLELPEVETTLSWRSLILFEPRLSALTVRAPRVVVRRTAENQLTVAGIDVDLSAVGDGDPALVEWLLRQRIVQIAGGEIEWQDEWKKLPPLRLREVNLRLVNSGGRHSLGMTAIPAAELAAPIDLRAEFRGSDLKKIADWDGNAFAQVDYADMATVARYLPLPIEIAKGTGGLRSWFEFEDGRSVSVTSDFVLRDARVLLDKPNLARAVMVVPDRGQKPPSAATTLASKVPSARQPLDVSALSGRLVWRETTQNAEKKSVTYQWSAAHVVVTTLSGERSAPISGELKLNWLDTAVVSGTLRASALDLGIASTIAQSTPLSPEHLQQLTSVEPRGEVRDLELDWEKSGSAVAATAGVTESNAASLTSTLGALPRFKLNAQLRNAAGRLSPAFAVSGVSGQLKTTADEGSFVASVGAPLPVSVVRDTKKSAITNTVALAISNPLVLNFGDMFPAPIQLDSVKGRVGWTRMPAPSPSPGPSRPRPAAVASSGAGSSPVAVPSAVSTHVFSVALENLEVSNADTEGRISGTWRSDELGPGSAKLTGTFKRANLTSIHKYLPSLMAPSPRNWLRDAIIAGEARDITVSIDGPLWHFPFIDDKQGVFDLKAKLSRLTLDYADGWPRADEIETTLALRGAGVDAQVSKASIAGVPIGPTRVRIADTHGSPPTLDIQGSAAGPMDGFLGFMDKSPVGALLGGFTAGAKANGNGKLALSLAIPLEVPAATEKKALLKVGGEFAFENNRVDFGGDIPVLDGVTGKLVFSEKDARATSITANALGGPVVLNVSTEGGRVRAQATGQTDMSFVSALYNYPFVDQIKGSINWALDTESAPQNATVLAAGVAPGSSAIRISGVLAAQRLPFDNVMQAAAAPRDATLPIGFVLQRVQLGDTRDLIDIEIPDVFHLALERAAAVNDKKQATGARVVERAVVDLGAQKSALPARGYSVRGDVHSINADEALSLLPALTGKGARNVGGVKSDTSSADFVNINLRTERAVVFSHLLTDVSLRAQPTGQRWRLALRSREATGTVSVDSAANTDEIEAVSVRLQKFSWPTPLPANPAGGVESPKVASAPNAATQPNANAAKARWPKLDLIADSFVSDGRELGKLEVKAQPAPDEWRIDSVKLSNPDGSIEANGRWRTGGANVKTGGDTSVDVAIKWADSAKFMQRMGLPKGVDRAEGSLVGSAQWVGSPAEFAYETMGGKFTLKTGAGRFTETDPGIGKLLGVLSLQSLPRRLSFNFDDLFSKGFAFDSVNADVSIVNGVAKSEGFNISGPAARVEIRGTANIALETQALRVRVFPSISVATAIGIGLVTANPAIGAAAWLGQKLARDPVERILMQEFDINGSWSAPEVKQNNPNETATRFTPDR